MTLEPTQCPTCGSALAPSTPGGLCARCLWASLLAPEEPAEDDAETPTSPPTPPPPKVGATPAKAPERFGGYELLEEIARGGMGIVYRARQIRARRVVALKMIRGVRLPGEVEVRRFRAEAEAVASLNHPNIVPIYEVGEQDGCPYFTMRLVSGGNLASHLAANTVAKCDAGGRTERIRRLILLMTKVARAVDHAHRHGILHRDLKPSNILLDEHGEPLVSDFGLAKQAERADDWTLSGMALGTPAYMAPEQALGGRAHAVAADVYSLGAILYEMLTEHPPFQGKSPLETLRMVADADPAPPSTLAKDLDRDLETVCLKCLRKDPAQRYDSAELFSQDLERWLRNEPVLARRSSVWELGRKWARRHPALAALILLAAIAPAVIIVSLVASNAKVRAAGRQTRENLYAADIFLADQALRGGNLGLARATLAAQIPPNGQAGPTEDFRGFEWRWLWRQCQGDQTRTLTGFPRPPTAIAVGKDGNTLVIAGQDMLWRWRLDEPRGVQLLPSKKPVWLPPAEAAALVAKIDATPYLPLQTGSSSPTPDDLSAWVNPERLDRTTRLAFALDDSLVVAASRNTARAARAWSVDRAEVQFAFPAYWSEVAVSPTAPLIAVGSRALAGIEGCVKVYDIAKRCEVWALPDTGGFAAFSGDGETLATAGWQRGATATQVSLWSISRHQLTKRFLSPAQWDAMAFSPDARWFAFVERDTPTVELWSAESGSKVRDLKGHLGAIRALAFSPDSRVLATAGVDQRVREWSIPDGTPVATLAGHTDEISAVAFFPDGKRLASASRDGTVRIWATIQPPSEVVEPRAGGFLGGLTVSPDGHRWASTAQSWNHARMGGTEHGAPPPITVPVEGDLIEHEGFDDDGRTLMTSVYQRGTDNLQLEWRHLDQPTPIRTVPLEGAVNRVGLRAFCPGAGLFAVGLAAGQIRVWSTKTGALLRTYGMPDHIDGYKVARNVVKHLAFSPDGRFLAAGVEANTQLTVFSLSQDTPVFSHHVRPLFVPADTPVDPGILAFVVFSPDSKLLATGDETEPGVRLWDPATGRELGHFAGHRDRTVAAAFSPDGRTLATTGGDGSLKLWHLRTHRELGTLLEAGAVGPVIFSPDGNLLLAGLSDRVRIFRTATLAEIDSTSR